jgi:uncharacterized protein YukJ
MALKYGFLKAKVSAGPTLQGSRHQQEIQYHLHTTMTPGGGGAAWDTAVNVGTNDADDLLKYKIALDYTHPVLTQLRAAAEGFKQLTGTAALPALDFLRSDILAGTGPWRESGVMDGSESPEPVATLLRLMQKARAQAADVYVFGRTYTQGAPGMHDVHMNQGSSGAAFLNEGNDKNDHNDIWQDGAVLIDFGTDQWAAYFTVFTQQTVPTDHRGNPTAGGHGMSDGDDGSLA